MANFEDILHDAAQRNVKSENRALRIPKNPLSTRRSYWGWVATPVAAVIGVVLGLSLPLLTQQADDTLAQITDTVYVNHTLTDTVYLAQAPQEVIQHDTVYLTRTKYIDPQPLQPIEKAVLPQCTSVQCDGINYSMLVSN